VQRAGRRAGWHWAGSTELAGGLVDQWLSV
jgi:hypothetical protein